MKKISLAYASVTTLIFTILPGMLVGIIRPLGGDESIFLYGGMTLKNGNRPYIDFWDHKGPLLYIFNEIGLRFELPNYSGTVLLQLIAISISLIVLLRVYFVSELGSFDHKKYIFFLAIVLCGIFLTIHTFGTTELWSLPFQMISYALITKKITKGIDSSSNKELSKYNYLGDNWTASLVGLSIGSILLLRPNNAFGVIIALFVFIFSRKGTRLRIKLFLIALASLFFIFAIVYLRIFHSHPELITKFYEQYIVYNSEYSSGYNLRQKAYGFFLLSINLIKLPIFGILIMLSIIGKKKLKDYSVLSILIFFIMIDFFGQTLSGRGNSAYLVAIMASIINLIAFALKFFSFSSISFKFVTVISFLLIITNLSLPEIAARWHDNYREQIQASSFLVSIIKPDDEIFFLGNNPNILVRANKTSISQVVYLGPLLSRFYQNQENLVKSVTNDVILSKPTFIIQNQFHSCRINAKVCYDLNSQYIPENVALKKLRLYIADNYSEYKVVGNEIFYKKKVASDFHDKRVVNIK